MGEKKGLYALLGVREYVVFDPLRDYLTPNLRAWRLESGEYLPVAGDRFQSTTLGVELVISDDRLRVFDPAEGVLLPTRRESEENARRAEERAAQAEERAVEAEDRAAHAEDRAVRAEDRAVQTQSAFDAERERRVQLEAEVEALRRQLRGEA